MRMDMRSDNPCMRDLVAYRVKYVAHPHCGDKWCIYPSYDFTHCLNDSFEDITHSLCTLEFLPRRESYYWLLDALELYKPIVWEFGRLNITHTVLSKRKLLTLVNQRLVRGWDDPRLPTLNGLRRKGYTAATINSFCEAVGVTTNTVVFIDYTVLEHHCRQEMEGRCRRAMCVVDPVAVEITNWEAGRVERVERPNHPVDKKRGTNTVPFSKVIYIDRADFRIDPPNDFWGLAPGKEVGLRYAHNITCTSVVRDAAGAVTRVLATYDPARSRKPQGHIHWVAQPSPGVEPRRAEVRLYEPLFKSARPDELTDWQADINPSSLTVVTTAFVDETLTDVHEGDSFQFERVGFFCVDKDTSLPDMLVFNRTVPLRESKEKEKLGIAK
eukprot:TRINITY_DN233_c0_g1_i5.p1 TRINITY_DN233_c0_g1~~TRINITY_DN233_c0_g1_i5.p1  ORF type:complete len:384 (+),score=128.15 TRINITY_DN233_c0_g1_i5:108-1259(+)